MAFDAASPAPVQSAINALLVPLLFVSMDKAKLKLNDLIRVRLGMFPQDAARRPVSQPARRLLRAPHGRPLLRQ